MVPAMSPLRTLSTLIHRLAASLSGTSPPVTVTRGAGSSPSFLLSHIVPAAGRTVILLLPQQGELAQTAAELSFYSQGGMDVLEFPPWDIAPFEQSHPHPDIVGKRLRTLARLATHAPCIVVTTVGALGQRVLPRRILSTISELVMAGEESPLEWVVETLVTLGYAPVPVVEDRGTFARRGGILDIFPPDADLPVRLEYFGDTVESIRTFDPLTQRSRDHLDELVILPGRELILTRELMERFPSRLKVRCDDLEIGADRRRAFLEEIQRGHLPPGVEFIQPILYDGMETLLDHAGSDARVVVLDPSAIREEIGQLWDEIAHGERRATEHDQIVPPVDSLYLDAHHLSRIVDESPLLFDTLSLVDPLRESIELPVTDNGGWRVVGGDEMLVGVIDRIRGVFDAGVPLLVVCRHPHQGDRLERLLEPHGVTVARVDAPFPVDRLPRGSVCLVTGGLSRGFTAFPWKIALVAEEEIFGVRQKRRGLSKLREKQIVASLADLKPGDPMVHVDFGIGLYRGLIHLKSGDVEGDFLLLEYGGGDKLYLPVDRLNLVQKYAGGEGAEPRIDRLGGTGWEKAKARARAAAQEMAEELLSIQAARQLHRGTPFSPPDPIFREFEAEFAYEETPDQLAAIEDVIADMVSDRPMDRLVCGDVGYGKTEVAMRAAFKAVLDGRQVAVLVPTTILAQQHYETFTKRFANHPVTVEVLSRFRPPAVQKEILKRLAKGEVDIIIGTHRLLQSDVTFRDLGLLVVDEEQRFGVSHKEKLKKLRATVDLLTLTATPIPRTLHMAMTGIRDLSIIDTPPVDRLAIKTFVARFSEDVIREAVIRELRRGGQVFFVHNRVQTIDAMAAHLRQIVPEATIAIGHGQMEEKELERVMLDFMHGKSNLLLCSTIIESGLDIPNANTLIVNRADTFGLSQLYQIRGRVGRSKQRAYAWFLLPPEGTITDDARERLRILQEITELGAGFRIASHDLELRGAGDLLGKSQSGHIAAVGFDLYTELLEEAIHRMRGEERVERVEPEIKLGVPAFIPETYIPQPNQRLILYKKLTQAQDPAEVDDVRQEMVDRFGPIPPATETLFRIMTIRIHLCRLFITELNLAGSAISCSFHPQTPVSPDTIISLIRKNPATHHFTSDFTLVVTLKDSSVEGVLRGVERLLAELSAG
ncbi:MAG: transcription-repair coupling factor [Desulfuromonadia bacterium]